MTRDGWRARRRRELSGEERALWAKVAETIVPMPGRRIPPPPRPDAAEAPPPSPAKPQPPAKPAVKAPNRPPPLAPMEPKLARALRRGAEVDSRLDLHGMRQAQAHSRLRAYLAAAQSRGERVVLVITGKGTAGSDPYAERGVLRRLVPQWLTEPDLRPLVVGFEEASQAHGGAGALYVRLRRSRT